MKSLKSRYDRGMGGDVSDFESYEDYIDENISKEDLYYLEDVDLARIIVKDQKNLLSRSEFEELKKEKRKEDQLNFRLTRKKSHKICGAGKELSEFPLLFELAKKEKMVRDGRLSTIIFIRDRDKNGHEISGYIDYSERLAKEDFEDYFSGKKKLLPKPSDLSYYNWDTKVLRYCDSSTFSVKTDEKGLLFKHKRDRKTIDIDPKSKSPGTNSTRKVIHDPSYYQVILYGHIPSRR